jgi:quercetin dioxygenase-like cupin family protein
LSAREVICADLDLALDDLKRQGYRLDVIYPADEPHSAVVSRGSESVRVTTRPGAPRPSPNLPEFTPEFLITRGGTSGEGRAGMRYRDLIPGRLGGRYVASHIAISDGGPVADWVHFHQVAFQMIAVRRGWVRVVYEDQGEPFVMHPGDIVLQPPQIRHRVLESSPGLEVVEIGCPALHETLADHDLALPNSRIDSKRSFGGQTFLRHVAGGMAGPTAMAEATQGVASVQILSSPMDFPPHEGELVFGFVLEGQAELGFEGSHSLGPADAFVIPPGQPWQITAASPDLRLLHVTTSRLG